VGHNPIGGWSVLLLMLGLLVQIISGLCAGDPDIFLYGPLAHRLDDATVSLAMRVHAINGKILLAWIVLHVLAVSVHVLRNRERLIRPMIDGNKWLPRDPGLRSASAWRALVVLTLSAGAVWLLLRYA
jgi:cytochrome b